MIDCDVVGMNWIEIPAGKVGKARYTWFCRCAAVVSVPIFSHLTPVSQTQLMLGLHSSAPPAA